MTYKPRPKARWCTSHARLARLGAKLFATAIVDRVRLVAQNHTVSMSRGAIIDGRFRYLLWRTVGEASNGTVLFIMLNPSTADAQVDDPTLRRCMVFARTWGFARLEVCNLFALRTPDPAVLKRSRGAVGPKNDAYIRQACARASLIVAAWGTNGGHRNRAENVSRLLEPQHQLFALRLTRTGHPAHPLYLPKTVTPEPLNGLLAQRLLQL